MYACLAQETPPAVKSAMSAPSRGYTMFCVCLSCPRNTPCCQVCYVCSIKRLRHVLCMPVLPKKHLLLSSLLCLLHQAYHKRTDEMEKLTIPIDVLLSFFLFVRSSSGEKQALPYLTLFKINENTEYIYIYMCQTQIIYIYIY